MQLLNIVILATLISFSSPDGRLKVEINPCETHLEYCLSADGRTLITPSSVSMKLSDGTMFPSGKLRSVRRKSVDEKIATPVYRKASINDRYNEVSLVFRECRAVFRLYDDSFAWRFEALRRRAPYKVASEQISFNFPEDWTTYATYTHKYAGKELETQFCDDFENVYAHVRLSELDRTHFITAPMMVEGPDNVKMVITESDVVSYPGMFLYPGDSATSLVGRNAGVPSELKIGGHNGLQEQVVSRHDYIAECDGSARTFPWRVVCVSREDRQMADNDAVYALAGKPDSKTDFSWVKPGRVAWEWLNNWGLRGVPFKPGVNTATYKCYIDFAAKNGLEYVILDEGWAVKYKNDLFAVVPEIDLKEIVDYAAARNVGILLWAGHYPFSIDMEKVCSHYAAMGVKGFKVDFMDRDDQLVEDFMYRAAETCARYHLLVDFHGTHKPTGLQRRFPNIINQEGIFGMEQMRKKGLPEYDMVTTDVIVPFVRYVAGFADYTPGIMKNGTRETFRPVPTSPMSQGTRCRQLAQYVIFDAPLNMLADSPSNYELEPDCLEYIRSVPTVWDETRVLEGKVGEYIVTARRKGDVWYIGAMTSWTPRDISIDLESLFGCRCEADCYIDGSNADVDASDFRRFKYGDTAPLKVHLAPGGGFAAKVVRKEADLIVYGGTASGVMAAYSAAQMGLDVVVVEPTCRIGGMTTGGLGLTDIGNKKVVRGVPLQFYRRLGQHYGCLESWIFEPGVAKAALDKYLDHPRIKVITGYHFCDAQKNGSSISCIRVAGGKNNDDTLKFHSSWFIDCSYEGDLMAGAGVSYRTGREDNSIYGETYNGVQLRDKHQFPDGVDPFVKPGNPASGLLAGINANLLPDGTGDGLIQAYNYRICLTDDPENSLPLNRPAGYDASRYELLARLIAAQPDAVSLNDYFSWDLMPGRKTDINNKGAVSTDFIGANADYPEADWERRQEIIKEHKDYTLGLLYFMANDPRVPEKIRKEVSRWGLPKDEYTETPDHWTPQLYVRECRRMVGEYVATQADCEGRTVAPEGIAMAAYTMDSHNCQRVAVQKDGHYIVKNEGDVQIKGGLPYPISYRSMTPHRSECVNLLVPVCCSASHIAYGSIRMEPVFMCLGQCAGIAVALAAYQGLNAVQDVDYRKINDILDTDPYMDGSQPDIIVEDTDAVAEGYWQTYSNKRCFGPTAILLYDGSVTYTTYAPSAGKYEVYTYQRLVMDGMNPISVLTLCDGRKFTVDSCDVSVVGQAKSAWHCLTDIVLDKGEEFRVTITPSDGDGFVYADAVMLVKVASSDNLVEN